VNQDRFAYAMGDLVEAENAGTAGLEPAIKDSKGFLEGRGVRLPADATVKITKSSPVRVLVCVDSHCVTVTIGIFE
jgi:hypothetical protein